MSAQLPHDLVQALVACAARLGRGLGRMEPLESRTGAPCHEINAVLNLMHELKGISPAFSTYATSTVPDRGRVDLVGIGVRTAVAVVAAEECESALRHLQGFRPSLDEVGGDGAAYAQWDLAAERWGVALATRHMDSAAKDQWLAGDQNQSIVRGAACVTDANDGRGHGESWLLWEARRIC